MIRLLTITGLIVSGVLASLATVHAQAYPNRPVHLVVAYPPGAGIDATGRMIAEALRTALGQPIVVENKAGASGSIAADFVSHADPDGYTLLYTVGSDMVWTKFVTRRQTIDPLKDLTPIATSIGSVNAVVVPAASPYKTIGELVAYAKQNPGKLSYGTSGALSYYFFIGQYLKQLGVDMLHVPYKGNAPALTGLLGGEIDLALTNLAAVAPQVESGAVRVLAVMEPETYPGAPKVPTVKSEIPAFNAPLSWFGFFGPPGLPADITTRLNDEIGKALQSPDLRSKIVNMNLNVLVTPAARMRPFVQETTTTFEEIAKSAAI